LPDARAEVVAVGSELLLGDNVDTNSAFLSGRLAEIGIDVHRHVTVGDNDDRLLAALEEACGRAEVVLVTGGLGPTQDDRTRDVVARLAGVELVRDAALERYVTERFRQRGRPMPVNNLRQADIPAGARVLTPQGTAAGFAVEVGGSTVYCMPGVPAELRPMFDGDVLPGLKRLTGGQATVSRLVRTAGMAESAVAEACGDLVDRLDEVGNPTIAFLAAKGETRVRVTGKASSREEALALIDPLVAELVERLGMAVVGLDDEGTEHTVARLLQRAGWTLALAESITAGGVGARLVRVPGASAWFVGGLVVYQTPTKIDLAGIDPELLAVHGPVSEPVAAALAAAARERVGGDVGLSVLGVAGPSTQGGAEVGTVCLGAAVGSRPVVTSTRRVPGRGRDELLEFAASYALDFLRRQLAEVA
jgi:nicotinamide-nucleotide amidase